MTAKSRKGDGWPTFARFQKLTGGKTSYLGRMLAGAQQDISQYIVKALGGPHGLS